MIRPDDNRAALRRSSLSGRSGILLAAVPLIVGLCLLGATPASAAPSGSDSTTVAGPDGPIEVTVRPVTGLPLAGAQVRVSGSGFDRDGELWVAVCQDDGLAPDSLLHCLGGAIPGANASSAWAVITGDGADRYPGPVSSAFSRQGSFDVTLQIPGAAGQDADCVSMPCSVYTRSADPSDRSQDTQVGIRFEPPPSSLPAPTTETLGTGGSTVAPDSVAQPSVAAGADQTVTFSGFEPGESVEVTLYSDPITLPSVQADSAGGVTIAFAVPADLPAGEHLVQAVGQSSGRIGVASFTVGPPEETSTSTASSTTSSTPSATSSAVVTAPAEEPTDDAAGTALPETETPEPATPTEEAIETPEVAVTSPATDGSDNAGLLWLLWVVLAVLLVGGGIATYALMRRSRGSGHGPAAAFDTGPVFDTGPGFDTGPAFDTGPLGGAGAGFGPGSATEESAGFGSGPATEEWLPPAGFGRDVDAGPPTEQWQASFYDEPPAPASQPLPEPGESPAWTVLDPRGSGPDSRRSEADPHGGDPDPRGGRHHAE